MANMRSARVNDITELADANFKNKNRNGSFRFLFFVHEGTYQHQTWALLQKKLLHVL